MADKEKRRQELGWVVQKIADELDEGKYGTITIKYENGFLNALQITQSHKPPRK